MLLKVCPEDPEVPFNVLKIADDLRLLLLPEIVQFSPPAPGNLLVMPSGVLEPELVPMVEVYDFSVSPDLKWIYFTRPGDTSTLWVSSPDGSLQWAATELSGANYAGYASWVTEDSIFIIGSPKKSDISLISTWEYMPFARVNPFTLEKNSVAYLNGESRGDVFYYGTFVAGDVPYGMYGRLNMVDFLYDFMHDTKTPVFSWLDGVKPFDLQLAKPVWTYGKGLFAITVVRPYGFDIAYDLEFDEADQPYQYQEIMQRVYVPAQLLPSSILGIVPVTHLVALHRNSILNPVEEKQWFYSFDYRKNSIIDYCFEVNDTIRKLSFSPDGRFAAFSLEGSSSGLGENRYYVVVLDLQTGERATLRWYTLADWIRAH